MGSSHNEDYTGNRPAQPDPSGVLTPTPQPLPQSPVRYPSFLGNLGPRDMATGLTQGMLNDINMNANPPAPAPAPPGAAAAASAPGGPQGQDTYVPPEVSAAGPEAVQAYLSAKASGNDALAARIALSAQMMTGGGRRNNMPGGGGRVGGMGGAMDRGGYSTSGRTGGAYSGPGGTRSSARYGGGLI